MTDSGSFEQADAEAIVDAVEQQLADDGVRTVRFDGAVVEASHVSKRMSGQIRKRKTEPRQIPGTSSP